MVHFRGGIRSIPHAYFVAAVRSALQAIARVHEEEHAEAAAARGEGRSGAAVARVSILVFSEGPKEMTSFHVPDEYGHPVEWNIPRDACQEFGLDCYQVGEQRASKQQK